MEDQGSLSFPEVFPPPFGHSWIIFSLGQAKLFKPGFLVLAYLQAFLPQWLYAGVVNLS